MTLGTAFALVIVVITTAAAAAAAVYFSIAFFALQCVEE
jgi:hypothetical protein